MKKKASFCQVNGFRRTAIRRAATTAFAIAIGLLALVGTVSAQSLYKAADSPFTSMFSDYKARQVGDLLTIIVSEASYAQNRTQTQTGKAIGVDAKPGLGLFDFLPLARLDLGDSSKDSTQTSRSGRLTGIMTAEIIEVLPNGDLKIRGAREVSVNREKEQMTVVGTVRQRDILPNNTISSSMVANAEIAFSGAIYTGEKGGVFKTLWDGLVTVFNWIF
ncbi:MAG: flagellar basal body L-ring protein FlgH [Clostridia bacterium]|nr:flagellar basal body L-ring protein FlgH [Clostridia bacterium]